MSDIPLPAMSEREARDELQVTPDLMRALLNSGLLGYWDQGRVPRAGVEQYQRYGTQWRPELGQRDLPPQSRLLSGRDTHPASARFWVLISPHGAPSVEQDNACLAQFYLRPNPFFFLDPEALGPAGPLGFGLDRATPIMGAAAPTVVYPHPDGSLAMVSTLIADRPPNAFEAAYDVIGPFLDELSVTYDQPLPVAQIILVGVPSGTIATRFSRTSEPASFVSNSALIARCRFPELADAGAFYREGISSNNPFHQFLALWKCYESAGEARREWRYRILGNATDTRLDVELQPERFPDRFTFEPFVGMTFGKAKEQLWRQQRCALAHGDTQQKSGKPKTGARAKDYSDVFHHVPIVRYMAWITLRNARATVAQ